MPVRNRVSFAKLDEVLPLPDLVGIQRESFDWLLNEGLKEVLEEVSPIEDFTEQFQLYFGKHQFKEIKYSEEECRDKDMTYSAPLFVEATFVNKVTGEIKEQEVFMGDFPIMTDARDLHHQRHRAGRRVPARPLARASTSAVSSTRPPTRTSSSRRSSRRRGAWLEFDVDKKDTVGVRIDRKRRQNVTVFLKALGWSADEILEALRQRPVDPAHAGEGPRRDARGGPRGHLPQAPAGRAADGRVREDAAREPVLQPQALRRRAGRPPQGRQEARRRRGLLLKQLRAHHKALAELDNPDKKAWEQDQVPGLVAMPKDEPAEGRAQVQGHPDLRGHPQDGPLPREAARR